MNSLMCDPDRVSSSGSTLKMAGSLLNQVRPHGAMPQPGAELLGRLARHPNQRPPSASADLGYAGTQGISSQDTS